MRQSVQKNLLWLIPIVAMVVLLCFLNGSIDKTINADDASELVLARLLKEENSVLSKDWYYSTELRLLNTNLVYSFFFRLTDSWHTVRILSLAVMLCLLLLTVFLYGRRQEGSGILDPLVACLLVIPTSELYYLIVLKGGFYLPHITIPFLMLAMGEGYLRARKKVSRGLLLGFSAAIALLSGMGGPRQILTAFAPMLLAALWIFFRYDKEKKDGLVYTGTVLLAGVIGYGINVLVLSKVYAFKTWTLGFAFPTVEKLDALLKGFLTVFGYRSGTIGAGNILANLVCAAWIGLSVLAIVRAFRKRNEVSEGYVRIAAVTCAAMILFILLYLFTDMFFTDQYFLPVILFTVPLLMQFFRSAPWKKAVTWTVALVFLGGALASGGLFLLHENKQDYNAGKRKLAAFLTENGYHNGYATFWNANILTELSNGKIEVWTWEDNGGAEQGKSWPQQVESVDEMFPWLQRRSHDEQRPEGKVFVVMTIFEYEDCPWVEYDTDKQIVYEDDVYCVLGFDNYAEMKEKLMGET